jgi:DNA-binding beta-propeller fold protein YncE
MIFTLALTSILVVLEPQCPQGAEYLRTASDLPGALGIAAVPAQARQEPGESASDGDGGFDGFSGFSGLGGLGFLVCVPEAIDPADRLIDARFEGADVAVRSLRKGAFGAPVAVDVRSDGAIVVADAAGFLVMLEGSSSRKLGETLLQEPAGVTFHPKGIAVSDRRARAVLLLDGRGAEVARLGLGQIGDPRGLAALDDGSVLVADRLHDCVWRFGAGADRIPASAGVPIGEFGSNPGQFNAPGDVAILGQGASACVLVADELNHRIQILDGEGRFAGFFGMHALVPRMGEGNIHYPRSIAVSADGTTLAVAEAFEDRVQFFRLTPEPQPPGIPQSTELISSHFGPEVACAGDLLALIDIESEAVGVLDARTTPPIHMTLMGGGGASPQRFREVSAIAIEPTSRRVWIADRGRGAIDVYDLLWDSTKEPVVDLFMPRLARSMRLEAFARRLAAAGGAVRTPDPADLAFGDADADARKVLILDRANMAVIVTDPRLASGELVSLPAEARTPEEIAVSADGRWAVADSTAQAVFLRSADGRWSTLRELGGLGFVRPSGAAFLPNGAFAISDAARDAVIVGTPGGSARLVGGKGVLDEQFWDPQAIAPSPRGEIVVDRGNHRYQRFGRGLEQGTEGGFEWNLTGSMGRYYDRKRRGSPGGPPLPAPAAPSGAAPSGAAPSGAAPSVGSPSRSGANGGDS